MICLFAISTYARKIRKQPELKSGIQRPEEIVLMTRQNIARLQTLECARQSRTRIWQSHTQNCEIDLLMGRQPGRCSARVDIDALAPSFDKKRQRFAACPVRRTLRRTRTVQVTLIERHLAEETVVGSRQHTNFPLSNSPDFSGGYCVGG